jgi:dTDP-L-rhamnose 4-epimerase
MKVLVTGGVGFIGSHTVDMLLEEGHETRVLDNLEPQVHGKRKKLPEYFNKNAELIRGDVLDRKTLIKALDGVDAVIHLASAVGVGQSMYQIDKYVNYNTHATALLLDVLVNEKNQVKKFVVASSMSMYGEGKYSCKTCGIVYPALREEAQMKKKEWEPKCPNCGRELAPLPTDENKPLMPNSIYAQSKRHQEEMSLLIGKTYGIPTVALRYFNVFGSRQSLSNPYTGVCAIFSSRILNNNPPHIFEDGGQTRDFIHVKDVARANLLAVEKNNANYMAINVGRGEPLTIKGVAEMLIKHYKAELKPFVSNKYRKGDVRHCYADMTRTKKYLNFRPEVSLKEGFKEITAWARAHDWGAVDLFDTAMKELEEKELLDSR